MSRLLSKFLGFFRAGTIVGADRAGNRYFTKIEEIDGVVKEKRWVTFQGEEDPTSIPVEWICWLSGQRKQAPTPQEMIEMEAQRECVKLNVARLKREEDERVSASGKLQRKHIGEVDSPDLKSFIQQFPGASFNQNKADEDASSFMDENENEDRAGPKRIGLVSPELHGKMRIGRKPDIEMVNASGSANPCSLSNIISGPPNQ